MEKEEDKTVSTYKKVICLLWWDQFSSLIQNWSYAFFVFFFNFILSYTFFVNSQHCPVQVPLFKIQIAMAKVVLSGIVSYWPKIIYYATVGQAWGIKKYGFWRKEERI